jgi:hypothetical protein
MPASSSCPCKNAAITQENHGIRGVPVYAPGHGLKDDRGIFALAVQSPGFDAGVVIPNFNDALAGSGPDIGAQEAGSPPMQFGVDAYRDSAVPSSRPAGRTGVSTPTAP